MDKQFVQHRLLRILPATLWMLGIFVLSSQSHVPQAPGLSSQIVAIAGHLVAFGMLAVLIVLGVGAEIDSLPLRAAVAFTITIFYGVSDEIHQSFVTGRHATAQDVVVDAIGAAASLSVLYLLARWHRDRMTS